MADDEYNAGGRPTPRGRSAYDSLDPYTRESAGTPIWGWLSGQSAQVDAARAQDAASQNQAYWDALNPPTASQLMGPQDSRDAQGRALAQMQQWSNGQLTGADRGTLEASRSRDSQAQAGQQRALMQQAQGRGVGGGGLDFATRQQSAQASQQQASDSEAQALSGAQQRGLQANQQAGQLASGMRQTGIDAVQQAYEDAAQRAAGATGQYSTDVGSRNARAAREQQRDQGIISALGALIA